ncbi:hypothetical protein PAHAL_3G181600 [Panicum hallii]|uniref:Uncharacterized protein n=1 Tax=Panicum hallii TaxID=206008 RepID=A0A2T8KIQ4_9POAL|nr:hypothetical protein PAHAL_3G181600 [Panicum hallii]
MQRAEPEGRWSGGGATLWIRRTFHRARAQRGRPERKGGVQEDGGLSGLFRYELLIDHGGDDWFPISRDSVSHRRPSADALSLAAPHRPAADVRAGLLFSPSRRPGEATSSRAVPSRPCAAGSRAAPASCFLQTSAPTAVSEVPSPASPPVDASMFRPVPPRGATDVRAGLPPPRRVMDSPASGRPGETLRRWSLLLRHCLPFTAFFDSVCAL